MRRARHGFVFVIAMCLTAAVCLPGCDGCSCGSGKSAAVVAPAGPAAMPAVQPAPAADSGSQLPKRLDSLAATASLIPSDAQWVAVFDPARIRDVLHKVARVAPKLTRGRDYKDIHARILDLYGVDTDKLQGPCLMAGLKSGGRFMVCAGIDKVVVPVDASIWSVAEYSGPVVFRRNSRISMGVVDGRFVAGGENAVFEAVNAYVAKQPSLGQVFARKSGIFRDLAAEDAWGGIALFFPGRNDPGWCPPDACLGTALFSGTDRFIVVSIANGLDMTAKVRDLMAESWRALVRVPWEAARANPRIPPDLLRDGDMALVDNSFRVRGDRVILDARGDLLDVLSVVRMDDIDWLLGL